MGDEYNQVLPKCKLFRVFRISRLLPNVHGEKYSFKRISANSWLSPIGGDSKEKRCSSGSYKPVDSRTDRRLEQCQRRAQTAAEMYRKRKRENQLDTSDVLEGIQLKANDISLKHDPFANKSGPKMECREGRPDERVTRKIKLDITIDTGVRLKTCPSHSDEYSDPALGLRDLLKTSTVLNKPKCSKESIASAVRPSSYSELKSRSNKVHWTETVAAAERTRSAPPFIRAFHERKVSNFGRPESKSPQFLKSRANTFSFDSKISTIDENDKDIPNRRAVLRSLLQKRSPAMNHSNGCPFNCKNCFKACLVSEDYYKKMKVKKANQKQTK